MTTSEKIIYVHKPKLIRYLVTKCISSSFSWHVPHKQINADPGSLWVLHNQMEGESWIYVKHVNLASFWGRPVNLRATRKFTGQ